MRVTVGVEDLVPALLDAVPPGPGRRESADEAAPGIAALRLDRARTIASSLDVRGARVDEALEVVGRYLEDGLGIGPQVQARLRVTFVEPA